MIWVEEGRRGGGEGVEGDVGVGFTLMGVEREVGVESILMGV